MKPRIRCLLWLVEVALVLLGVWFEPTCMVRGTLRGEAFYDGKPTSWWRRELERWDVSHEYWRDAPVNLFQRSPTWIEQQRERWLPSDAKHVRIRGIIESLQGPRLVHGEAAARPVLRELLDDPSRTIRRLAQIGLQLPVEDE